MIDKKMFAIPAWLDMIESCLKNVATTMIACVDAKVDDLCLLRSTGTILP